MVCYEIAHLPAPIWLDSSAGFTLLHLSSQGHGFEARSSLDFSGVRFATAEAAFEIAIFFL